MIIESLSPVTGPAYPAGTMRIDYRSDYDGVRDWALFTPGHSEKNAIVYLHGALSEADQIFTRQDVRDFWLRRIQEGRHPLLSVNMRGTSCMSPAATADMKDLLAYARLELGCGDIVLLGGSGGAFSAVAYALVHPETVQGVIAMGMCDLPAWMDFISKSDNPVLQRIAQAVFAAYGGSPQERPAPYEARSVLAHADRLTMPVVLTMGEADKLIPVAETRKVAAALRAAGARFVYHEVPGGDHDSAVWVDVALDTLAVHP